MGDSTEYCKNCKRSISSANFASHSAFCERRIKLCEICDEPVQISAFKEHEKEYHSMVACENCDSPLEKWLLPKHQESCSRRLVPCEFCEAEFPFDEYPEHKDFCGSRTEKCIYCRKYIMIKEMDVHNKAHQTEFKIQKMKASAKNEIQQNSLNEVISKTHLTSQFEKRFKFLEKEKAEAVLDEHVERNQSPRRKLATEASSSVRNESESVSKHYGVCHICKEHIPWVDMNIHIPTCASSAGKCSRCGDRVPSSELKNHILKTCPKLKGVSSVDESDVEMSASGRDRSYEIAAVNNPMPDSITTKSCPFCNQICDEDRILEHIKNCDQNTYECPLCSIRLPEREKRMHESFYCKVLLDINCGGVDPNMTQLKPEISRNKKDRTNIESVVNNSEACPKCKNSIPKFRWLDHLEICRMNVKPCKFCGKYIRIENEKIHLNNCPSIRSEDVQSRFSLRSGVQNKGAVPKYADQVNLENEPESVACTKCVLCEAYVPVKDIENHLRTIHKSKKCCHNKGKKCPCQKQNNEGNSKGPVAWLVNQVKSFAKSDPKEVDYYSYRGNLQNSSDKFQFMHERTYSDQPHESLYFSPIDTQQDLIPCEFCEQTFPMSEIVLHSTGCKPDEVSFATKNNTPEDRNISKSNSQQKRSPTSSRFFPSERNRCTAETTTSTVSSRHEYLKRSADSLTKPGEFLDTSYQNTYNKNISKYENMKPEVDQALKNQYSEVTDASKPTVVSLWNLSSASSDNTSNAPSRVRITDFLNETIEKNEEAKNLTLKSSSYIKGGAENSTENSSTYIEGKEDDISVYVNYIHKKEVSSVYEEEEPKKHKNSEMEPINLKLSNAYSSRMKDNSDSESENVDSTLEGNSKALLRMSSDSSDSEFENVDSALQAYVALESKKCEDSSKIQAIVGETDKMDVDSTLPVSSEPDEQIQAFKIEPATQCLSAERKMCKKTWKIEAIGKKAVDEDSTKMDIAKQCLADFKFGMNKNVCNENIMDCEESSAKDENENQEAQPAKTEPAQKHLQNGATRDKIAANFYDNIQESHDDFVKIAYKYKLSDDQKRSSTETTDDEIEKLEKWIKWRSRKTSDSE